MKLALLSVLALAPPAAAQSLNIDLGEPSGPFGPPPAGYAAAAGPGQWNAVDTMPPGPLRDLAGAWTPVELTITGPSSWEDNTEAGAPGSAGALLNDGLLIDANLATATFHNLIPGSYRVYTYGCGHLSFFGQDVTVQGVTHFLASFWNGAHTAGDDYVVHTAQVGPAGTLSVQVVVMGFSFITIDGFQLVRVGQVGTILCQADGTIPGLCPCGNDSTGLSEGCVTTAGNGMRIWGTGSGSLSADDLTLMAVQVPVSNTGIFYVGQANFSPGNHLFDGLQCTGGNALRFQGQFQTNGTVSDTGFVAQDPSGIYFTPGTTYVFQYFTRDNQAGPSPCGGFANLSPGLRVVFAP